MKRMPIVSSHMGSVGPHKPTTTTTVTLAITSILTIAVTLSFGVIIARSMNPSQLRTNADTSAINAQTLWSPSVWASGVDPYIWQMSKSDWSYSSPAKARLDESLSFEFNQPALETTTRYILDHLLHPESAIVQRIRRLPNSSSLLLAECDERRYVLLEESGGGFFVRFNAIVTQMSRLLSQRRIPLTTSALHLTLQRFRKQMGHYELHDDERHMSTHPFNSIAGSLQPWSVCFQLLVETGRISSHRQIDQYKNKCGLEKLLGNRLSTVWSNLEESISQQRTPAQCNDSSIMHATSSFLYNIIDLPMHTPYARLLRTHLFGDTGTPIVDTHRIVTKYSYVLSTHIPLLISTESLSVAECNRTLSSVTGVENATSRHVRLPIRCLKPRFASYNVLLREQLYHCFLDNVMRQIIFKGNENVRSITSTIQKTINKSVVIAESTKRLPSVIEKLNSRQIRSSMVNRECPDDRSLLLAREYSFAPVSFFDCPRLAYDFVTLHVRRGDKISEDPYFRRHKRFRPFSEFTTAFVNLERTNWTSDVLFRYASLITDDIELQDRVMKWSQLDCRSVNTTNFTMTAVLDSVDCETYYGRTVIQQSYSQEIDECARATSRQSLRDSYAPEISIQCFIAEVFASSIFSPLIITTSSSNIGQALMSIACFRERILPCRRVLWIDVNQTALFTAEVFKPNW